MIKRLVVYVVSVTVLYAGLFAPTAFAAVAKCKDQSILGFPAWFKGLNCDTVNGQVTVQMDDVASIWVIVMNIVQWLIIAGGYVAVYFIIWGGFKYITSAGDPQKVEGAKNAITNAVIGFVIVLASVAIIKTIQASVGASIK